MATRLLGIDAGRFFATVAVVLVHTASSKHFLAGTANLEINRFGVEAGDIIDQLSRFAVPFFFVVSGIFLARQIHQPIYKTCSRILKRLLPLYLLWTTLYIIISPQWKTWISQPAFLLRWLMNGGASVHLWFLIALAVNMCVAVILRRYFSWRILFLICGLLYLAGLALGSYAALFFDPPNPLLKVFARNSPTFGLIFVVFGMYLTQMKRPAFWIAMTVFIAGAMLQLTEAKILDEYRISPFSQNDFLLGTLPFGAGSALIAIRCNKPGSLNVLLANIGENSLGIYLSHILFVRLWTEYIHPEYIFERLAVAVLAFTCAGITTIVFRKDTYLGYLVR